MAGKATVSNRESEQQQDIVAEVERFFLRYLALRPGLAFVMALWSVATYFCDVFDAFGYLAITSPTKRCGKTRACELLGFICLQALQTVSISPAALYRLLKAGKRTLIIDEAEHLARRRDERSSALWEVLNSGYRKGAAVYRCTNFGKEPEAFDTYCPKVLVLIGRLLGPLADRCIENRMDRLSNVTLERFRYERVKTEMAGLQQRVACWAKHNRRTVEEYYAGSDLPFLRDRESELWLPLFCVCAVAAHDRLAELEAIAQDLAQVKSEHDSSDVGIRLLRDIRSAFSEMNSDALPTELLLKALNSLPHAPWGGWSNGEGLNSRALSDLLDAFAITSQNIRYEGRVLKGYKRRGFEDSWRRYL